MKKIINLYEKIETKPHNYWKNKTEKLSTIDRKTIFQKNKKLYEKSYKNLSILLDDIIYHLIYGELLPPKYNDHSLKSMGNKRSCHVIGQTIILIYEIQNSTLILWHLGTHDDVYQ